MCWQEIHLWRRNKRVRMRATCQTDQKYSLIMVTSLTYGNTYFGLYFNVRSWYTKAKSINAILYLGSYELRRQVYVIQHVTEMSIILYRSASVETMRGPSALVTRSSAHRRSHVSAMQVYNTDVMTAKCSHVLFFCSFHSEIDGWAVVNVSEGLACQHLLKRL